MSQICQVTGKRPQSGHLVSHSNRKTKRRFNVNLRKKRYWLEDENRWVTLRVSARGMRIIDKVGLGNVVKRLRAQGQKV